MYSLFCVSPVFPQSNIRFIHTYSLTCTSTENKTHDNLLKIGCKYIFSLAFSRLNSFAIYLGSCFKQIFTKRTLVEKTGNEISIEFPKKPSLLWCILQFERMFWTVLLFLTHRLHGVCLFPVSLPPSCLTQLFFEIYDWQTWNLIQYIKTLNPSNLIITRDG